MDLPVFKSLSSVHAVPLYFSVKATSPLSVSEPPNTNPAVNIPAPPAADTPLFLFPPDDHAPLP